jgi:hypothetical protein
MPEPLDITTVRRITNLESEIRRLRTYDHGGQSIGEVMSAYMFLPALRAFWPFSSQVFNAGGVSYLADVSGHSRHMAARNAPTYGILNDILPYGIFDRASSQSFNRPDEPEMYPAPTYGLTIGCWCSNTAAQADGTYQGLISKWGTVIGEDKAGLGMDFFVDPATHLTHAAFRVDETGVGNTEVVHTTTVAVNSWHFVAGRFTPSTEIAVFDNGVKVVNTTSIPASINRPDKDFVIGGYDVKNYLSGYITLAFVCADALPDAILARIFKVTRHFFGV